MKRLLARLKTKARLQPIGYRELQGWQSDEAMDAYGAFLATCKAVSQSAVPLRNGLPLPDRLVNLCQVTNAGRAPSPANHFTARKFFESNFQPYRIMPLGENGASREGFVTGYYEPEVAGSLVKDAEFTEPLLSLPANHVRIESGSDKSGLPAGLTTALAEKSGRVRAYPDRAAISKGAIKNLSVPLIWVRDGIEAFMIHVQGSARIRLKNGRVLRIKYAGRNGYPYSSIGRALVRKLKVPPSQVTMSFLKHWVRNAGQGVGEPGRQLMEENKSYIFFELDSAIRPQDGPVGAAGVNLFALRSMAIDRTIWPYGLPFWLEAVLPWQSTKITPMRRLMIAQDTGSAIRGPARADIFFGSGDNAGSLAGAIRHSARLTVLLPK